ncbi:MAG: DUF177 domain-containing protein [Gaiellales bacterium]
MTTFALRNLRLRPGEEHEVTLAVAHEPFLLGGQTYVVDPPTPEARLTIQRATGGDVFRLRFAATLVGPCMRCLADARVTADVDATEYNDASATAPPELRTEYVADGDLDVSGWARDQLAFELPQQILCRPDCAGLCAVCGKNLNDEPHEHDDAPSDPRWAALEALRQPRS